MNILTPCASVVHFFHAYKHGDNTSKTPANGDNMEGNEQIPAQSSQVKYYLSTQHHLSNGMEWHFRLQSLIPLIFTLALFSKEIDNSCHDG